MIQRALNGVKYTLKLTKYLSITKINPTDPKTEHLMGKYISDCRALEWVGKHISSGKGITVYCSLVILH